MADKINALPSFPIKKRAILRKTSLAKVSKKRGRNRSLRKKLWKEFSERIRARDGKCLMEDQGFGKCGGSLQGSHIFPKGKYPLIELYPLNVIALCYYHHLGPQGWHHNPWDCVAWLRRTLPVEWIDKLIAMKNDCLWRKQMDEVAIRLEWRTCGL